MEHNDKKEDWTLVQDSQPLWKAIQDNTRVLNKLYSIITKIEETQDSHAETLKRLVETTDEIQEKMSKNLKNIDDNMKDIDHDIEYFEKEVECVKREIEHTKTTLMENREIFTKVMDKFMKLENEEIKPKLEQITNLSANSIIIPSYERTLEQNRLWRLYSNHFRQNVVANSTNIMTQLSLSKQ